MMHRVVGNARKGKLQFLISLETTFWEDATASETGNCRLMSRSEILFLMFTFMVKRNSFTSTANQSFIAGKLNVYISRCASCYPMSD